MTCDLLFLAKNRLEFTKASFTSLIKNTDWALVSTLWIYDDGSADGTREWLLKATRDVPTDKKLFTDSHIGAPAGIMNDYLTRTSAYRDPAQVSTDMFAKIDNDVIVPPWWLNDCLSAIENSPDLDLLGIEPPQSRTPHIVGGVRSKTTENDFRHQSYAPCDSIGGIGLMRRGAFKTRGPLKPYAIYGGFTDWQLQNRDVTKGWIVPPLKLFLLDRLPTEPWVSLSKKYIANGWQRAWSGYDPAVPFWDWWKPEV